LMPKSDAPLEAIFHELEAHPEVKHLLIEGHTNNNGSASFNYRLGRLRAESVMIWLEKRGIDRNRLIAKGYGFDVPLLPHDHPDATHMNRRVVFLVLRPEGDSGPAPAQTVFPKFSLDSETAATGPVRILEFEGMDFPPEKNAPPVETKDEPVSAPAPSSDAPAPAGEPGSAQEGVGSEDLGEVIEPEGSIDDEPEGSIEEVDSPVEEDAAAPEEPEPEVLGIEEDTGRGSLFGRRNRDEAEASDVEEEPSVEEEVSAEEASPAEPEAAPTPE